MVKPKNDEAGVLIALAVMGAGALLITANLIGQYWPYLKQIFH